MKNQLPMTQERFIQQLIKLCLRSGMYQFPSNETSRQVLFKSMVLLLDKTRTYTDKEINQTLEYWLHHIFQIESLDYITVRRWLVDAGYLSRNREGSAYAVSHPALESQYFDETVEQVDIEAAMQAGREEIERKKRSYMEKSRQV